MSNGSTSIVVTIAIAVLYPAVARGQDGGIVVAPNMRRAGGETAEEKRFNEAQQKMEGRVVLVSLIRDGKLVGQKEMTIQKGEPYVQGAFATFEKLNAGTYEVKIEGEGVETVVKKGLQVSGIGGRENRVVVIGDLRAGKGTRVIEYGKEGDPYADLEKRLRLLEEAIKALKK